MDKGYLWSVEDSDVDRGDELIQETSAQETPAASTRRERRTLLLKTDLPRQFMRFPSDFHFHFWPAEWCSFGEMTISNVTGPYGRHIRQMFYLVSPWETMYARGQIIPNFVNEAAPWLAVLIFLETLYFWRKGRKDVYGLNDSMVSVGAGFVQHATVVTVRMAEFSLYCWIYEHWCLYELPWNSVWTWLATFVVVDFAYYWAHRACHEVNLLWAFHQTHHSSEYYNLTTALRQGMFQQYITIFFNLPAALLIPPEVYLTHLVLNLLYQIWLHTQVVGSLGPLEMIINTPSNHRVHHGRNRYCLDKNYAGVLVIWDRLFGTYQSELESEPVVYGLTDLLKSFDAFHVQLFYLKTVLWDKPASMTGVGNKLRAVFFGPGWYPGTKRRGNLEDIQLVTQPVTKYDSGVQRWVSLYVLFHGSLLASGYHGQVFFFSWPQRFTFGLTVVLSVQACSFLLEKRHYGPICEICRCSVLYFYWLPFAFPIGSLTLTIAQAIMIASASFWILYGLGAIVEGNRKKLKLMVKICQEWIWRMTKHW